MTPVLAGAAYFAIAFAIGFMLGTIRVLGLAPAFGETAAVLIEGPIILGASWIVCSFVIRRFNVRPSAPNRLIMGAVAFALLIGAEILLGVFGFSRSLSDVMNNYATPAGAIGLAGQALFGLFPLLQLLAGARQANN